MQRKCLTFIPSYNYEMYVGEALESVLTQSYPNHKVIVVDDHSSDHSVEIVKEFQKKYDNLLLFVFEERYGNIHGVRFIYPVVKDKFDFMCLLCSDDVMLPNYWETVLPHFEDPDVGVVRIGCYMFTNDRPEGSYWRPQPMYRSAEILDGNRIFASSPIRMEAWRQVGEHDVNTVYADWDFWIRMLMAGWKFATIQDPLYKYRRHDKACSFSMDISTGGFDYKYMALKHKQLLKASNWRTGLMLDAYMGLVRDTKLNYEQLPSTPYEILNFLGGTRYQFSNKDYFAIPYLKGEKVGIPEIEEFLNGT